MVSLCLTTMQIQRLLRTPFRALGQQDHHRPPRQLVLVSSLILTIAVGRVLAPQATTLTVRSVMKRAPSCQSLNPRRPCQRTIHLRRRLTVRRDKSCRIWCIRSAVTPRVRNRNPPLLLPPLPSTRIQLNGTREQRMRR
jgi:hypothetical protein